jgi:DNA-binding PadR family transcriptional regulator
MTKARAALTELEGAILGVLRRAPETTAYAVRKVFAESWSAEWSGSAGAVYPAIQRLTRGGLIRVKRTGDRRGGQTCSPTVLGARLHDDWLCDVARAAGPGMDPFRTRAALWSFLPKSRRKQLMATLARETRSLRDEIRLGLAQRSAPDALTDTMVLALLDERLRWLGQAR